MTITDNYNDFVNPLYDEDLFHAQFDDDSPRWEPTVEDERLALLDAARDRVRNRQAGRRQITASYGAHIGPVERAVYAEIGEYV